MSSLTVLGYGEIRVTEDGRYSVYDTIKVIGGKKNPRDAWNALGVMYPEVVGKTDNFKFPGGGQRFTPVANAENTLYIIGLLPGTVGHTYREDAARLMITKLEGKTETVISTNGLVFSCSPKEISEAIACVLSIAGIDPMLIAGVAANEIGKAHPALKPHMEAAKKFLPLPVEQELLTVTDLAKKYVQQTGNILSKNNTERGNAMALNKMLIELGFQVKNDAGDPNYLPTEIGQGYSKVVLQEGQGSNKTCQQLRWYPTVLERLA